MSIGSSKAIVRNIVMVMTGVTRHLGAGAACEQ